MSFRKVTRSTKVDHVRGGAEKAAKFQEVVKQAKIDGDVPDELLLNVDQVGVRLIPSPTYTYATRGSKQVSVLGHHDKREVTMVLTTTCAGGVLPPQVIYTGRTERSHPKAGIPPGWHITHTQTHWSNKATTIDYIGKILAPYLAQTRALLGPRRGIVLMDCFSVHKDTDVIKAIEALNCTVVHVPAGLTAVAQPNDALYNGMFKRELKSAFTNWYMGRVRETKQVVLDTRMTQIRDNHLQWMKQAHTAMTGPSKIVQHSWAKVGLRDLPMV
jgi:hypothetical protein